MKIKIIHCGKIARSETRDLANVYLERLSHFSTTDFAELKLESTGKDKRSDQRGKSKQDDSIVSREPGDFLVLLHERGRQLTSVQFSKRLQECLDDPRVKTLKFVVGPSYGFNEATLASADEKISLSSMTLPSDFAFLLGCEQLYRAFSIIKGTGYHHD